MASFNLTTKYRPLRIGFCVSGTNHADLIEAARLNTILCGGMYNPIIQVEDEIADDLIKLFQVDLLYPVSGGKAIQDFIKAHENLHAFDLEGKFIWSTDQGWGDSQGRIRSRILDAYWSLQEYAANSDQKILNVQWRPDDACATLFSLEYGVFPSGDHPYNMPVQFKEPFFDKPLRVGSDKDIDIALALRPRPIDISTLGIRNWDNSSGWKYHGIYIGDSSKYADLVEFWNLRASGLHIIFIPITNTERFASVAKLHIDRIAEQDRRLKFPNGVGVWSHGMTEEMISVIMHELKIPPEQLRTRSSIDKYVWNGLNLKSSRPILSTKTIIADVDQKYGTPRISFQLPDMPTSNYDNYNVYSQHFCVTISPITEFEYEGYTLKLPYLPDMNEWYGRRIKPASLDTRIEPDAITLIIETHDAVETIYPIQHERLVKRLFERAGIKAVDSQAGLLAQKLIERMGELDGCRVFKIPGVRKLIASLGHDGVTTFSNATQVIRDLDASTNVASFAAHERLYIQAREVAKLTPNEVFRFMLGNDMFRAGLELVCQHCKLKPWFAIDRLDKEVICEYCGGKVELSAQLKDRGDWRFRKSGLFGSENHQEGAVPVVLTLLQFLRQTHIHEFVYSTALKLDASSASIDCETDIAILGEVQNVLGRSSSAIAIGEIKSNVAEITDQDITNLSRVKDVLDKSGVKTYLVFAKTAQFTDAEIERFKKLVEDGIIPILFTDHELEPYEPYDYYRDNKITIPHQFAMSFEEMAKNSLAIYLT